MSVGYSGIQWNRQKRWYDAMVGGIVLLTLATFIGVSLAVHPRITVETLVIRGAGVTAFALLHVVLCIGPLARLDRRFLPLLYNRRHLGVTVFFLALVHAGAAVYQFHALGTANPLASVFLAYRLDYNPLAGGPRNLTHFPFEPFGALALGILFLMAATSHDFWLRNLGPSLWKALHLLVLPAYGLLVLHVAYGALQSERSPVYVGLLGIGVASVLGLHLAAARRETLRDRAAAGVPRAEGFVRVCPVAALEEGRGRVAQLGQDRVALYRTAGRVYALSNVCRHQGGPLGEGRILDGCITCPWHGWQYRAEDGCSPPPFQEKVETYRVRIEDGFVYVHPEAAPAGTPQAGALLEEPR
jgi:nitrite reductase/ring-hydroxylating ferredoxin subunit